MKTVINKQSGKVLFAVSEFTDTETEIGIDEILTQSFAVPFFNQTTRLFYEGGTVQEVTDWQTAKEEAEDIAEMQKLDIDGNQLYFRHRERIRRRIIKGLLTVEQGKTVRKTLRETHLYLKSGDFDIALDVVSLILGQPAKIQTEVDWLKNRITNYLA